MRKPRNVVEAGLFFSALAGVVDMDPTMREIDWGIIKVVSSLGDQRFANRVEREEAASRAWADVDAIIKGHQAG